MKKISAVITILFTALMCSITTTAQRTTRRHLKPIVTTTASPESTAPIDTVNNPSTSTLVLTGYDKPLRSTTESMFIKNLTGRHILSVTLHLEYLDMSGRQLHLRDVTIPCDIPPGQTRQITFRSWDRQKSFVYHRSQRPRRADYSPYKINASVSTYTASQE